MTAPSVFDLIRRYDIDPKKSLGQNFLVDETHLARIAAAADLEQEDTVLEIGPGLGVLTRHLAEQAGRVIAVELDDRLISVLQEQFEDQPHVTFVHGDILEIDPAELMREQTAGSTQAGRDRSEVKPALPYKVVANLPYYITSAVLRHLLESGHPPTLAVVMVQREVAKRIVAGPGDLSLLAVGVQFYAHPAIVQKVPAGAFYPQPKVDSAVLRLDVRPEPAVTGVEPAWYFEVVRAGFGQKRKQLRNSISSGLHMDKDRVVQRMEEAGVDSRRRAETLTLEEWGRVARRLQAVPPEGGTSNE